MLSQRKIYVKAKEVKRLTGWNDKTMHKARMYNWIEWKKDKKMGFIYNLNSIPTQLIETK